MSESNYLTSALSRKPRPASKEVREARIFELDVSEIQADPTQPRKHFDKTKLESLALSIIKNEQLTPIQVISLNGGGFQIIDGERRWRAIQLLGLRKIKATFREVSDEMATLRRQLASNIEHAPMNKSEIGQGILRLIGHRIKSPDIRETIKVLYTLENKAQKRVLGVRQKHVLPSDEDHITDLILEFMPKEEDKKTLPPKEKSDTNRAAIRKFVSDYVRPIKKMIDASLYDALQSGVLSYAAAEQLIKLNEKEKRTELLEFAVSHTLAELSAEVKRLNGEVKEKVKAERDKFAQKMRGLTRASLETLSAARKKRALSLMGQLERVLYEEQESEQSEQSEDQS